MRLIFQDVDPEILCLREELFLLSSGAGNLVWDSAYLHVNAMSFVLLDRVPDDIVRRPHRRFKKLDRINILTVSVQYERCDRINCHCNSFLSRLLTSFGYGKKIQKMFGCCHSANQPAMRGSNKFGFINRFSLSQATRIPIPFKQKWKKASTTTSSLSTTSSSSPDPQFRLECVGTDTL